MAQICECRETSPWKTVKGVREVSKEDVYTALQISITGFLNHLYDLILTEMQRLVSVLLPKISIILSILTETGLR